jgi:hypothetical protein
MDETPEETIERLAAMNKRLGKALDACQKLTCQEWLSIEEVPQQVGRLITKYQEMHPLSKIAQNIVEEQLGTGRYKEGWSVGHGTIQGHEEIPVLWTTIECSQCHSQVYFDKTMHRHRCSKCGFGF